jgi:hypothetical protein
LLVAFLTEDVFEKKFQVPERIPLSALAPARRAAAASEPKAPPCLQFRSDQIKLALLCLQVRREAADLLLCLRDSFAKLRRLALSRGSTRYEEPCLAGQRMGNRGVFPSARELIWECNRVVVVALRKQPCFAGHAGAETFVFKTDSGSNTVNNFTPGAGRASI